MEQKIPVVSDSDIKRIIKRDYPNVEGSFVLALLSKYKSESKKGKNRIFASILKLAEGKTELIEKYVEKANEDYRDILALSEYPHYSKYAFEDDLSSEREKELNDKDWEQYQKWFL